MARKEGRWGYTERGGRGSIVAPREWRSGQSMAADGGVMRGVTR